MASKLRNTDPKVNISHYKCSSQVFCYCAQKLTDRGAPPPPEWTFIPVPSTTKQQCSVLLYIETSKNVEFLHFRMKPQALMSLTPLCS